MHLPTSQNRNETGRRLFFALWPDAVLQQRMHDLADAVLPGCGKPVSAANLHLTLVFLGGVRSELQHCVEVAASTLSARVFDLSLDISGYWPRPRVIWLGCHQPPEALQQLQSGLEAALSVCGYRAERRPFAPHVTLLRKVHVSPPQHEFPVFSWQVRDFVLAESLSSPAGVRYEVLRRWSLAG